MWKTALGAATVLTMWTTLAAAQPAIAAANVREGKLWFDGRATVGDFTGTTTTVTGHLTGGAALAEVRGWVEAPVGTLLTGNGRRDKDLLKSMEAAQFPTIRFELKRVVVGQLIADTSLVELEGAFIIHGVTRPATIPGRVIIGEQRYQVRATTPLNLKDYGIGGLSKMLGILKMHEDIVVGIDLEFAPAAP